jgi:hypothetical protein
MTSGADVTDGVRGRSTSPKSGEQEILDVDTALSDPSSKTIARGYGDGFQTATIFARYSASRLGFKGQYIRDTLDVLGPSVVAPDSYDTYTQWFEKGLADAEAQIERTLNGHPV